MQRRAFISFVATLLGSSVVIGCQKEDEQLNEGKKSSQSTTLPESPQQPHDANILKIGMDTDFAPFEFYDSESHQLAGFDVDMATAIAKQMNKTPEIVELPFVNLVSALDLGKIDAVMSCMAITEDRKKVVDFTQPYYRSSLSVIANENNSSIKSVDDLRGKKVGARQGSTSAIKVSQITDAKVVLFDSLTELFHALEENKIDAVINDLPAGAYFIIQGGKGKLVGDGFNAEDYAIAVKKGNLSLLSDINQALDTLEKNGTYTAISEKWFGK